MDIAKIVEGLQNCPCGRTHEATLRAVEIGHGLTAKTGELLEKYEFPHNILLVADKNTLAAADGIRESLRGCGYKYDTLIYSNLRTADINDVRRVMTAAAGLDGILSVGTGSLNDICRYASFLIGEKGDRPAFAIFATAPSMDGFASGSAPITENSFKTTYPAVQPDVLIADTAVLAASPAYLKSAGFGDMIAKYVALADWRISNLLTGEYYCDAIAQLTREALRRITSLADKVTLNDEESAGAIMEALVFTGVAMKLAGCVRPASGAEHMISHFWEMKKLESGEISDFHGKKVGIATLYLTRLYHELINAESVECVPNVLDWKLLEKVFGENFIGGVRALNNPTVTSETTPELIEGNWKKIREIVKEEIPAPDKMLSLMNKAGAATMPEQAALSDSLARDGMIYHAYLRHRLTLSHLIPMIKGAPELRERVINEYYNI